ncbi:cell surface protein [Levilactobacillus acidifarinae DSM 19394]|uniref:Cell surface protein n=1 Tax=Levilactobacillus acidifarinae DSM 19394 = JCM 15949 TaxID=1423715 RepID=A0A0R1LF04_9LACO|nr:cell surface protein [Levilactobacillus acidifarinae DSM 19394]
MSLLGLIGLSGMTAHAQTTTLTAGTYTVPTTVVQDHAGQATTTPSTAAQYFGNQATVTVKQGQYQITLPVKPDAQKLLQRVTVDQQPATLTAGKLTFTVPQAQATLPVTFDVTVPGMGKMTTQAWFQFVWDQAATAAVTSTKTKAAQSSSTTATDKAATTTPKPTTATKNSRAVAKVKTHQRATPTVKSTPATTQGWTYRVLQANGQSVSAANKFYTHTAVIHRVGDHYQVQLAVKYAKNAGMTQSGFRPVTTNGEPAQNVVYGTSGNYYTVSYTFDVPTLATLKHQIKGTVHVVVPTVGIKQTFTVQFKFSHRGSATTGTQAATGTPTGTETAVAHHTATGQRLPQTNDQRATGAMVLGIIGLISGGLFWKRGN